MTFLAPLFLVAAGLASLVVVGLHFLVTRPPPLFAFPTARFIPRTTIIVTSLARRPQDLLLLLLRVLALMLIGAAFARPVLVPRHRDVVRIIVADRGWSLGSIEELRDSVGRIYRAGDRVILLDSMAREITKPSAESLATIGRIEAPASHSAALVAARRIGAILRLEADSIDVVLVSPLARESWDDATSTIRATWPGRIQVIPLALRVDSLAGTGTAFRGVTTDPLRSSLALMGGTVTGGERVRLVRETLAGADSAWANGGGTLIHWPATLPSTIRDTSNAVASRAGALVYPFERSTRLTDAAGSPVVARWIDGEPAAVERPLGKGCIRETAIPVTSRGDFVLRPDFLRLLRDLTQPCAGSAPFVPLARADVMLLAGGPQLASREQLAPPEAPESPLVPWLFALAMLLLLLEPLVRRAPVVAEGAT